MSGGDVFSKIGSNKLYKLGFNDFAPFPNSLSCHRRNSRGEKEVLDIVVDSQKKNSCTVMINRESIAKDIPMDRIFKVVESLPV